MDFRDLKLDDQLLEAMSYLGFETPTEVQREIIPVIFENKDVIACAQTGTGKTAAFVLPILNKLIGRDSKHTDTLVIVPTRELAIQIEQQIQGLGYFMSTGSIAVYGGGTGKDWEEQKKALKQGVEVVVATPGKLLTYLNMGYIDFNHLNHLVLDEADRMLDMGFIDDINKIISYLPAKRQTMMFSATMAPNIRKLARNVLHQPEEVNISLSKPAEGIDQHACLLYENQKIKAIRELLDNRRDYKSILIFTSTKSKVSEIVNALRRQRFSAGGISSNLEQEEREDVLRRFESRQLRILVATDVVSRGIDVKDINMVINYDLPGDAEAYVHRIGRTARVDTKGESVTFVTPQERHKLKQIERLIEKPVPRLNLSKDIGPTPSWDAKPQKNKRDKRRRN